MEWDVIIPPSGHQSRENTPAFGTALATATRPLVGAHRGASAQFPENTLAAFNAAIIHGADFLELDVQLSRDKVPVVIHDPTIDRTTGGHGRVCDLTAAQLSQQGVPLLEQVLQQNCTKIFFNIELKPTGNPAELVRETLAVISAHQLEHRVLLSSFEHKVLPIIKKEKPAILTGLLYEEALADPIGLALSLRADALHPYFRLASRQLTQAAHRQGLFIIPWTLDRPLYLRYFRQIGVDGLITNTPDIAIATFTTGK